MLVLLVLLQLLSQVPAGVGGIAKVQGRCAVLILVLFGV